MTTALADASPATPPQTLRAGQYLRVSLDKDKDGPARSTDQQQAENEAAAAAPDRGWPIVQTYRDDNRSASRYATKVREDYARLLVDLEAGKLDVLILWEPSRGSRKVSEWARLLEVCQERHVLIYVTSHGRLYDPTNHRDERTLMEDAVDGQYESGKVSMRVRRDSAARAAAGKPHGPTPYGYERLYDDRTRKLIEQRPKAGEAEVVREVFKSLAKGVSLKALAATLNGRGVPTKRDATWSWSVIRSMALNATYIGKRTHHGTVTDGTWPPLIDEVTFYAVRRLLTDPARKTTKPGKVRHLVSLIARCGECDGSMSVTNRGSKGETYHCRDRSCIYINKAALEECIEEAVLLRLSEEWEALTAGDDDDAAVLAARTDVARIRAELDELYDQVAANPPRLSPAALARIEPRKLAQLADAERRATEAATPPVLRSLLGGPREQLRARWDDAPIAARRAAVKVICARITVRRNPIPGHRVPAHQRTDIEWTPIG